MKAILTILFVLFIGLFAQAQGHSKKVKAHTPTEQVVVKHSRKIIKKNEVKVARLYMDSHYKVKKELSFTTKANKSKLA